jgi:hypothetical protein
MCDTHWSNNVDWKVGDGDACSVGLLRSFARIQACHAVCRGTWHVCLVRPVKATMARPSVSGDDLSLRFVLTTHKPPSARQKVSKICRDFRNEHQLQPTLLCSHLLQARNVGQHWQQRRQQRRMHRRRRDRWLRLRPLLLLLLPQRQ